jgi:hypothetical protein
MENEKALRKILDQMQSYNNHDSHYDADRLLLRLVNLLKPEGKAERTIVNGIVRAYKAVPKWYA